MIELNVENQPNLSKQEPVTKSQSSSLNSMALFWDIENVRVPKGKTAEVLTQIVRSTFSNGYNEIEFVVVCDVTKETEKDIKDLIKSKVKLIHISSTSKNAAYEKLKQSVRRFADIHGNTATVALISSDINFAPDLSDFRHRKKMYVILLHNNHPSKALISCANEHHNLMKLMKRTSESAKVLKPQKNFSINNHPIKRPTKSESSSSLPPIGIYWNLECCPVPYNKSASLISEAIRNKYYDFYREADFLVVYQDIDKAAFLCLNEEIIKNLIPKIGLQAKFLEHWKKEFKQSDQIIFDGDINELVSQSNTSQNLSVLGRSVDEEEIIIEENEQNLLLENANTNDGTFDYFNNLDLTPKLCNPIQNLYETLNSSLIGNAILNSYKIKKMLDPSHVMHLADLILQVEMRTNSEMLVTPERLLILAEKISLLFPTEEPECWYIPYKLNPKTKIKTTAKGPLQIRYEHWRGFLLNCQVVQSAKGKRKEKGSCSAPVRLAFYDNFESNYSSEDLEKLNFLKNNIDPWSTIRQLWQETSKLRIKSLLDNQDLKSFEYISTYPILTHPNKGLQLVSHNMYTGVRSTLVFWLLPLFIKTSVTGETKNFRANKSIAQNNFILHAKSEEQLIIALNERKKYHEENKIPIQPLPVIVGESLTKIDKYYVIINDIKYEAISTLDAIDSAFKSFYSLQLDFPKISENIWILLQHRIYRITGETDKNKPELKRLINQMKLLD
ncbi:hypothetical protein HCN44_004755 [Aphidius gifuensis]|uniref:NYN domain-containing protein n=1 Tax=Aphidius gifuensis TaxID=684658 RepID=A0A835CVE0_APHGI|nr:hypothetical protein HCN44_004755 [Aphidius gifuensis]